MNFGITHAPLRVEMYTCHHESEQHQSEQGANGSEKRENKRALGKKRSRWLAANSTLLTALECRESSLAMSTALLPMPTTTTFLSANRTQQGSRISLTLTKHSTTGSTHARRRRTSNHNEKAQLCQQR
jgi:hypothetical protein